MKIINNNKTNYKDLITVICIMILDILIIYIYMLYTEASEPNTLIKILVLLFYALLAKIVIIAIKIHKQHIKEELER